MSTNIYLEEVPFAILEAVKARIMARRQQIVKPRPSTRPRPQFRRFGASSRIWRKPEYAAASTMEDTLFAFTGYSFYKKFDSTEGGVEVFSMDTLNSISEMLTIPLSTDDTDVRFSASPFILPIDGTSCILVLMALDIGFNAGDYRTRAIINRAYLVSKSAVRQLSIPGNLQAAINELNPENSFDIRYPDGDNTSDVPPRQIRNQAVGISDAYLNVWTPKVFEILNNIAPFTSPSAIQQYPNGSDYVVNDWRYGYAASDPSDWSLYFAKWLGDPADIDEGRPDLLDELPDSTILLPPNWYLMPLNNQPGNLFARGHDWFIVWNWDDPEYCRAMCTALGFSSSDLTP